MFNEFELDDLGILPMLGESAEEFIKRGNMLYEMAISVSDEKYIDTTSGIKHLILLNRYEIGFFTDHEKRRQALREVYAEYGIDMYWVRFLSAKPLCFFGLIGGLFVCLPFEIGGREVDLPVIFINNAERAIKHEIIHSARMHCGFDCSDIMEENIAEGGYFYQGFWLRVNITLRHLQRIRQKLQRNFGERHGYVFIRLNYSDLMAGVLYNPNPKKYLLARAKHDLKSRIMCEKLGIL
jgi:hypothetical protein